MNLIRSRIASGEYPTDSQIPSTSDWIRDGWSRDTTRTAITRLQRDGILRGHDGKGVFVAATPEQARQEQASLEALAGEVGQLRAQVAGLQKELTKLRKRMGQMEVDLANAAEESDGGKRERTKTAADSGRR
jgi:DNA-binding GntR family transcriptional regulator